MYKMMMMIAFITIKSSLVPLIEGLCEEKIDKIFADHVTQVCKAHDRVILSFLQEVQGFARPTKRG